MSNVPHFNSRAGGIDRPLGGHGETYLYLAVEDGDEDAVRKALAEGADVNKTSGPMGTTPLRLAFMRGELEIARLMLEYDNRTVRTSRPPMMMLATTPFAVELLCAHGAHVDDGLETGERLLFSALRNNPAFAEYLIKAGADPMMRLVSLETPLHVAARFGRTDVVNLLLDNGALPALHLKGGDEKMTPLHEAVAGNHIDTVRALITRGAFANVINGMGETPLHTAAKKNNPEMARLLIREGGADINKMTVLEPFERNSNTALHAALSLNNAEMLCTLVALGADPYQPDNLKRSPLQYAAWAGAFDCLYALMEKIGQDPDQSAAALARGNALHEALLSKNEKMVWYLLDKGCDINAPVNDKDYPLNTAIVHLSYEAVCEFLKRKANPNVVTREGWTPLMTATARKYRAVVDKLLEAGADPDLCGDFGTALHEAVEREYKDIAAILVTAGANPFATNNHGKTPKEVAKARNFQDLVELLQYAENNYVKKEPAQQPALKKFSP